MAALGWALTSTGSSLVLSGTEVGVSVGPGIGRELMLLYVGRIFIIATGLSWLQLMPLAVEAVRGGI